MPIVTDSPRHCSTQNYSVIPQHAIVNPELVEQYKCVFAYHANIPSISHSGGGVFAPQILKVRGIPPTTLVKTRASILFNGSIAIDLSRQRPLEFANTDVFTVLVKARPYAVGGEQCFLGNLNSSGGVNNGWAVGLYGSNLGWACIQNDGSSNALQDTKVGFYTDEINNFGYVIDTGQTDLNMITPIVNGFTPGNLPVGFSTAVLGSPTYGASNNFSVGGLAGLGSKYISGSYIYEIFIFKTRLDAQMFLAYENKPEDFWWWTGKNPLWTFKPPPMVTISKISSPTTTIKKDVSHRISFAPTKTISLIKRANKILSKVSATSLSLTISRFYRTTITKVVSHSITFTNHAVKLVNIVKASVSVPSLINRAKITILKTDTPIVTLLKKRFKTLSFSSHGTPRKNTKIWLSPITKTVSNVRTFRKQPRKNITITPSPTVTKLSVASHLAIILLQPGKVLQLIKKVKPILGFSSTTVPTINKGVRKPFATITVGKSLSLVKSVQKIVSLVKSVSISWKRMYPRNITVSSTSVIPTIKKNISYGMWRGVYNPVMQSFVYPTINKVSSFKRTLSTIETPTNILNTRRPKTITVTEHPTISSRISGWGKVISKAVSPTNTIKKGVSKTLGTVSVGSTVTKSLKYVWGIVLNVTRMPSVVLLNKNAYHLTLPFYLRPERLLAVRVNIRRSIVVGSNVIKTYSPIKMITLVFTSSKTLSLAKSVSKTLTKVVSNSRTVRATKIKFSTISVTSSKVLSLKKGVRMTLSVQKSPTITHVKRVSKTMSKLVAAKITFTRQWQIVFTKVAHSVNTLSSFLMPKFIRTIAKRGLGSKIEGHQRGRQQ